jgi:hypothetical protein
MQVLVRLLHVTPLAVQALPAQQGCVNPPQVPQLPLLQVPPIPGHGLGDGPVQRSLTQQPPLSQPLPTQQMVPAAPQASQLPALLQAKPEGQARPAQQARPGPPQAWHTPPTQMPPPVHPGLVAQQTVPSAPHCWQTPPTHSPAEQLLPEQQASPSAPQLASGMVPPSCIVADMSVSTDISPGGACCWLFSPHPAINNRSEQP